MTTPAIAAICLIAVILGIIICLAMILMFLLRVYERGGSRDVSTVAEALRKVYDPEWPTRALRSIKGGRIADDAADEDSS